MDANHAIGSQPSEIAYLLSPRTTGAALWAKRGGVSTVIAFLSRAEVAHATSWTTIPARLAEGEECLLYAPRVVSAVLEVAARNLAGKFIDLAFEDQEVSFEPFEDTANLVYA